jgi:folate-dependent phosphoribosylglycinamide formyltransferase PurN
MRIVILSSSLYSETACAMAVRMAQLGHVPAGVLALRTLDRATLLRKLGQWGLSGVANYTRAKLIPHHSGSQLQIRNSYLQPFLKNGSGAFRSMHEVAVFYAFPVSTCHNQNSAAAIARLKTWSPDVIIFAGGNILRQPLLDVPRLGVLNVHLALLPRIRGMSSPEWSLLKNVPVGITIHYMDAGLDTGPILGRYDLPENTQCASLSDLRDRLIAFGVEKIAEVITGLDQGTISAKPQSDLHRDNQFFVMHEWLQDRAEERLAKTRAANQVGALHG